MRCLELSSFKLHVSYPVLPSSMFQRDRQVVILHPHHQVVVRSIISSESSPSSLEVVSLAERRQVRRNDTVLLHH